MVTKIKLIEGMAMVGKGETNHWVPIDGPESLGGFSAGSRPMELVLIGLGGCTSMDVLSIMRKKRVPFSDFEVIINADRAEEHPKVFTKIELKFIVYGKNINEKDVARAIELSETKYCSVAAMLNKTAELKTSYEIIEK